MLHSSTKVLYRLVVGLAIFCGYIFTAYPLSNLGIQAYMPTTILFTSNVPNHANVKFSCNMHDFNRKQIAMIFYKIPNFCWEV